MGVFRSKKRAKFWYIDGELYIDDKRIRYHKESVKDKNFMSKKWCEEEEQKIIKQKKKESLVFNFDASYNFQDLEDEYLLKLSTDGFKERTISNVRYRMKNYYDSFFGATSNLNSVFNERKALEFKERIRTYPYRTNYKNLILTNYLQLASFATDKKLISYEVERALSKTLNPFKDSDPPPNLHSYTSPEDAKKVWESASNDLYKTVFQLFFYSGCRIGEFLAIQKRDITFKKDSEDILIAIVNINKQVFTTKGTIKPYLKNSSSKRNTIYTSDIAQLLYNYIEQYEFDNDDLIFNFSRTTLRRELDKAFKKANVPHNTFHGFGRKSIATYLYLTTNNAKLPQILLGHKEVDMTLNTYILNEALTDDLIKQLGNIEKEKK